MRRHLVFWPLALALAGCSGIEVPQFLGREGTGQPVYTLGGEEVPLPLAMTPRDVTLETALNGALLRVQGVAPTQGYHSAQLLVANNGEPDEAGMIRLEFIAVPPTTQEAVGPDPTRQIQAAYFIPARAFRRVNGVQVAGADTLQTLTLPK
jgi:hypothetical protein